MSALVEFAREELQRAGLFDKDSDYGGQLGSMILMFIQMLVSQGHSGGSVERVLELFEKLARFQPLTPLTGADDEWNEVEPGFFRNKRGSTVFKKANGVAYDINAKIFREPNGRCFISENSRVAVVFPYVPKTEYIDVPYQRKT